ncbi:MAG: restriction endonuclease subunit S [Methylobacter sp.]
MDAQQFLAEFGHIASAPGGVQRVRELILQLAISGDLTQRVERDTPASVLFEHNQNALTRHFVDKKMKRPHPTSAFGVKDVPWRLPEGWVWCRLGQVTNYGQASKADYADVTDDTWVLELEDIEKTSSKLLQRVRAKNRKFRSTKNFFPSGAVLYGKLRPYLDKVLIADERGVCTTEIIPISFFHGIDASYLRWYLKSPYFVSYASNSTHGMNLPRMGTDAAREAFFPFPPMQEQAHIVAKVDELMALCDKLEAQQQKLHKLHTLSRNAVLQAISSASSKEEFHTAWLRFQHLIPLLLRDESDVQHLRDIVFHLGVTGMFSSADSQPKTLSELFIERTTSYRLDAEELARTGVRVPALSEIRIDDTITVPINWCAMTLESACTFIIDCPHSTPKFSSTGFYCIDTTCIEPRKILWQKARTVSEDSYKERISRLRPKVGDLLFSREGTIGTAVMVDDDVNLCLGQRMMLFRFAPFVLPEYAEIFLLSGYFKQQYEKFIKGTAAKHLNIGDIRQLTIVFPSIEVQRKIVDVVNKLGAYCDSLNIKLSSKSQIARKLSEAAITSITGIRTKEEALKTPKTKLISKLRLGKNPDIKEQAPLTAILARHHNEMSAGELWQRYGGEIDAFYTQLKLEVGKGWIEEPSVAEVRKTAALS